MIEFWSKTYTLCLLQFRSHAKLCIPNTLNTDATNKRGEGTGRRAAQHLSLAWEMCAMRLDTATCMPSTVLVACLAPLADAHTRHTH